jgi:integrase/recombinase XerD
LDYLHPNMASKFSVSKFSYRIALELQRKSLATVLAILLQPGRAHETSRRMRQAIDGVSSLYGPGGRKYLTSAERKRFGKAADCVGSRSRLFCLMLLWSGGRVSEILALSPSDIDLELGVASIETLKRRSRGIIRQVPLPRQLLLELDSEFQIGAARHNPLLARRRLWTWSRTTAWRRVKKVMAAGGITGACAMPKGLRHAFGVKAFQTKVPSHLVQRWLGHASLRTTALYGDVIGHEERLIAARMWRAG